MEQGKKFSYKNSVSSHQADQDERKNEAKNLSYLTCLSSEGGRRAK